MTLGDLVFKVRSKNAGPFWVTVDVFCGTPTVFEMLCEHLSDAIVCDLFAQESGSLKRFEISDLNVIKFSFPRTIVQGCLQDRDMHGAQYSVLLAELELQEISPVLLEHCSVDECAAT